MVYLTKENLIRYGIYSGMKLGKVINMYGREVILEILKNNLVSEEVIKECGYHKVSSKENQECEKKEQENQKEEIYQNLEYLDYYYDYMSEDPDDDYYEMFKKGYKYWIYG